jgi:hypothetical protein
MDVVLDNALERCPFLGRVAAEQGVTFAKSIAINPSIAAATAQRRPLLEELDDYSATFRAFHGANGLVPLAASTNTCHQSQSALAQRAEALPVAPSAATPQLPKRAPMRSAAPPRALPLASMSMSFGGQPLVRICGMQICQGQLRLRCSCINT